MKEDYPNLDHLVEQYAPIVNDFYKKFPFTFSSEEEYKEWTNKVPEEERSIILWEVKCPEEVIMDCDPYEKVVLSVYFEKNCCIRSHSCSCQCFDMSRRIKFFYRSFKRKGDFPFLDDSFPAFVDMTDPSLEEYLFEDNIFQITKKVLRHFHSINAHNNYQSPILKEKKDEINE